jgi:hypothetical protein
MSEATNPSWNQFQIRWLMILIVVVAIDLAIARALLRSNQLARSGDIVLIVAGYKVLLYCNYLAIRKNRQLRDSSGLGQSFGETMGILIFTLGLAGMPLHVAVLAILSDPS